MSMEESSGRWAVGFVNEVVVGGKMMGGGGGKAEENDVATKRTCLVSFRNMPGGRVYEA